MEVCIYICVYICVCVCVCVQTEVINYDIFTLFQSEGKLYNSPASDKAGQTSQSKLSKRESLKVRSKYK